MISNMNLTIEINLTENCNFRCKYCYELDDKLLGNSDFKMITTKKNIDANKTVSKLNQLLEEDYIQKNVQGITLSIWGGEPFTYKHGLEYILEFAQKSDKITSVVCYTNGFFIDDIIQLVQKYDKFLPQISYDGIFSNERIDVNKRNTAPQIRNNILKYAVQTKKIPKLKPTLTLQSLLDGTAYLNLIDYYLLKLEIDDILSLPFNKHTIIFGTTFEKAHTVNENKLTIEQEKQVLSTLKRMYQFEQKYVKIYGTYFNRLYVQERSICSAHTSLFFLDNDFKIYSCHAVSYLPVDKRNNFLICDTNKKNWTKTLSEHISLYSKLNLNELRQAKKCKKCKVKNCNICLVSAYLNSKKQFFIDRFYDFPSNKVMCQFYNLVEKSREI